MTGIDIKHKHIQATSDGRIVPLEVDDKLSEEDIKTGREGVAKLRELLREMGR